MHHSNSDLVIETFLLKDDGIFPNSHLPVLLYKNILAIPIILPSFFIKHSFRNYGWTNNWTSGIFTYHHYHSNTHEVMGIIHGRTSVQLGGENGIIINVEKGDILILPAGVAHKNLGNESAVTCVGGYPGGVQYDMNYGNPNERPKADGNIARVAIPTVDPVFGSLEGIPLIWKSYG